MEGLSDPIQEPSPVIAETNHSEQTNTIVPSQNDVIEEKQAEATIARRPKRKAAQALSQAFLDDEYDSPPSGYKNSRTRQGGPKTSARRVSKTTRAELEAVYVSTAVPVNILPDIYEDVMEILSKSNENTIFDKYAIQNLVVTACLDEEKFGNPVTAREDILAYVLDTVKEDKEGRFNLSSRRKNGRFDSDWRDPMLDMNIIKRYHDLMESEEEKKKRSYRNEERKGYTWTRQDLERFKVAFKKYGYSPTANRKIAKAIGPHMHPNHVGYFKQRLRRMHEKKKVEEIVESEAWDRMVATAPEQSTEAGVGADVAGQGAIAGENLLLSPTTPALAAVPYEERQKSKAGSFLPKRKKKRKPPPPQTTELRQKRREERLAQQLEQQKEQERLNSTSSAAETEILVDVMDLDAPNGTERIDNINVDSFNLMETENNAEEPANVEIINGRTFRKRKSKPWIDTTANKKKKGRKAKNTASFAVAPLQHALMIEYLSPSSPRAPLLEFPISYDQPTSIPSTNAVESENIAQERIEERRDQSLPSPGQIESESHSVPISPPSGSIATAPSLSPLQMLPETPTLSNQSFHSPAAPESTNLPLPSAKLSSNIYSSCLDAIAPSPIVNEPISSPMIDLDFPASERKRRKLSSTIDYQEQSSVDMEPPFFTQLQPRRDISLSPPPFAFLPPIEISTQLSNVQRSMILPPPQIPALGAYDSLFQTDPTLPFPPISSNPHSLSEKTVYQPQRLAPGLIAPPQMPPVFSSAPITSSAMQTPLDQRNLFKLQYPPNVYYPSQHQQQQQPGMPGVLPAPESNTTIQNEVQMQRYQQQQQLFQLF